MTTVTAEITAVIVKPYFLNIALILCVIVIRPSISSFFLSSSSISSCCSLILRSMFSFSSQVAVVRFSCSLLIFFSRLAISSLLASVILSAGSPRALIISFGRLGLICCSFVV